MTDRNNQTRIQVPFGLRDGRLFEPRQVDRGLKCNCICPGCCAALVAKHALSGKVTPHFSHASETPCNGGLESVLHLAAKQLINDQRKLYLPELTATAVSPGMGDDPLRRSECVREGELVELLQLRLEEKVGCIRPDLIANTGNHEILVEIAYTSFVTHEKLQIIRIQGTPAIEVDISDMTLLNFEELARRLFEPNPKTTWLFHPDLAARESALRKLLDADLAQARLDWERTQQRQPLSEQRREAARIAQQQARVDFENIERDRRMKSYAQAASEKRQKARQLHARTAEFIKLSNDQKLVRVLEYLAVNKKSIEIFLPIPVRGASGIDAEPLVWQASVLSGLIVRALKGPEASLSAEQVCNWLSIRFTVNPRSTAINVAIWDYLCGLEKLQILHRMRRQEFKVAIPDIFSALELANDAKKGRVGELYWREDWPSNEKATSVETVFSDIYGNSYCWSRLLVALMSAGVREKEEPASIVTRYQLPNQGAMDATALRRYLLSAGFAFVQRY